MRTIASIAVAIPLMSCSGLILADAPTPPVQPQATSVTQSCADMKSKAKQECLKVARQMDSDSSAPETTSSSSSVDTVHHSSSVMETPEEKAAAAKAAKSSKGTSKAPAPSKPAVRPPSPTM